MTREAFEKLMEEFGETDFLRFERVMYKRSGRPDIHAFLLLDSLVPGPVDIVGAAEHDEIFLDIDLDKLAKVITEEQVRELVRCGVRMDSNGESLAMFV